MTPLAHRVLKQLTLPKAKRTFSDANGKSLLSRMDDIHCFECSTIMPHPVFEMACDVQKIVGSETTLFLPAPKTWIEHSQHGERFGYFLEEKPDGTVFVTQIMDSPPQGFFGVWLDWDLSLSHGVISNDSTLAGWGGEPMPHCFEPGSEAETRYIPVADGFDKFRPQNIIPVVLAFINTPRVIGRRQHMPHRGLERQLTKNMGTGKFPLHAWTEIVLEVAPPRLASNDTPVEAHLTGKKALHFCRSHLRIRNGQLERVRAHWRGDASLGIKRSRYKLQEPHP